MAEKSGNIFSDAALHNARASYRRALDKERMHSKGDGSLHDRMLESSVREAEMRYREAEMQHMQSMMRAQQREEQLRRRQEELRLKRDMQRMEEEMQYEETAAYEKDAPRSKAPMQKLTQQDLFLIAAEFRRQERERRQLEATMNEQEADMNFLDSVMQKAVEEDETQLSEEELLTEGVDMQRREEEMDFLDSVMQEALEE